MSYTPNTDIIRSLSNPCIPYIGNGGTWSSTAVPPTCRCSGDLKKFEICLEKVQQSYHYLTPVSPRTEGIILYVLLRCCWVVEIGYTVISLPGFAVAEMLRIRVLYFLVYDKKLSTKQERVLHRVNGREMCGEKESGTPFHKFCQIVMRRNNKLKRWESIALRAE